jgi:hypothetical protein
MVMSGENDLVRIYTLELRRNKYLLLSFEYEVGGPFPIVLEASFILSGLGSHEFPSAWMRGPQAAAIGVANRGSGGGASSIGSPA